ncbi:hypothetical protein PO80_02515 [Vibrio parahaemolyticus]|uniref:hypothetical protein n=1 Tax=Vibrio parahaemolyticus TaxID=670 RepID=UPI0005421558|nr:hypothetical protein [Vibrio parahaemolyticus]ELU8562255.1 hypothetical protein [Vibrio parahaemolyticus]KHF17369.1 hypothetical protein PO80_02515 [Vibrio parahaemolyticus]OTV96540.1 hypothetical protein BA739_23185 [Vibrio parahaemolyticus]
MKYIAAMLIAMFSTYASSGVGKNIDVSVYISKSEASEEIEIISQDKIHQANYTKQKQTFEDIIIPFRVRSPMEVQDNYNLTLTESIHVCEATPLEVSVEVDGTKVIKGDVLQRLPFVQSDSQYKWSDHLLSLSYPQIQQETVAKQCNGVVGIVVELTV